MVKYRDSKTGKVFNSSVEAVINFCNTMSTQRCLAHGCPLERKGFENGGCIKWTEENPEESARLMGYEVIEDTPTGEDNMDKTDKPRLAEVLGVEVGEEFIIREGPVDYKCVISQNGEADLSYWKIGYAINHPESVIHITRLTEAELAICRAVGAKWVSCNKQNGTFFVDLWKKQPTKMPSGVFFDPAPDVRIASVHGRLFPSVRPGDCISVEEVPE